MTKKFLMVPILSLSLIALTGCVNPFLGPDPSVVLSEREELKNQCHDSGGSYILMKPEGYVNAGYWCVWDTPKEESNK